MRVCIVYMLFVSHMLAIEYLESIEGFKTKCIHSIVWFIANIHKAAFILEWGQTNVALCCAAADAAAAAVNHQLPLFAVALLNFNIPLSW